MKPSTLYVIFQCKIFYTKYFVNTIIHMYLLWKSFKISAQTGEKKKKKKRRESLELFGHSEDYVIGAKIHSHFRFKTALLFLSMMVSERGTHWTLWHWEKGIWPTILVSAFGLLASFLDVLWLLTLVVHELTAYSLWTWIGSTLRYH